MNARGAFGLGVLTLTIASCGGTSKSDLLRILFDDPPGERPVETAATAAPSPRVRASTTDAVRIYRHSPYEEKDCEACHALEGAWPVGSGDTAVFGKARLRARPDELCYECHDDMTADALREDVGEVVHAPLEDGECLECHDPHQSRFPSLLKRGDPFENVCFECHDGDDVLESEPHATLTEDRRRCVLCHDPHASSRTALLKPGVAEEDAS
ncbi:MAG: cytochrome c3 family protein [bacterium]